MTTNPVTSSTSSTATSSGSATQAASSAAATVNYNQFLQLLVAELKNQDPTAPTDPTQYMSQLASFSTVEQQITTNNTLSSLLTSSALSQADDVIGRSITSADGNTKGTIASVTIGSSGSNTATLTSGSTIALTNGVVIS